MEILYQASRGAYLFQTHLGWGGGLFERGSLFNLAKTMVSVLHKELEHKVEKHTPDSRLSSWQAIISVQKETIFSTLVHLNNTSHWSIITQKEKSINFIPMK